MLGSLNSVENVGNGVRTFGKIYHNSLVACSCLEVTYKGLGKDLCLKEKTYTQYTVLFTTFRVPYAVLRDGGAQFWCFLLADLSVGVQTAARASLCPLFCRNPQVTNGKDSLADGEVKHKDVPVNRTEHLH